jgi:hypothetical protein
LLDIGSRVDLEPEGGDERLLEIDVDGHAEYQEEHPQVRVVAVPLIERKRFLRIT